MPQLFFCREKHEKPLAFTFTFSEVIREFQALPWSLVRGDMVFFWWGVHAWGREVAEDGAKNTFFGWRPKTTSIPCWHDFWCMDIHHGNQGEIMGHELGQEVLNSNYG